VLTTSAQETVIPIELQPIWCIIAATRGCDIHSRLHPHLFDQVAAIVSSPILLLHRRFRLQLGQSCSFSIYESERIDHGIAADEHAVPSAVVGEANAVADRHDRPALDLVGVVRGEGAKRGVVVADADVRTSIVEPA
jgi:hypothetical protein